MLHPEEIGRWLRARNSDLGHARPTALVGKGDFDLVRGAAEQHVARLEGRSLNRQASASTLDADITKLLAGETADAADSDPECVTHGVSEDTSQS